MNETSKIFVKLNPGKQLQISAKHPFLVFKGICLCYAKGFGQFYLVLKICNSSIMKRKVTKKLQLKKPSSSYDECPTMARTRLIATHRITSGAEVQYNSHMNAVHANCTHRQT